MRLSFLFGRSFLQRSYLGRSWLVDLSFCLGGFDLDLNFRRGVDFLLSLLPGLVRRRGVGRDEQEGQGQRGNGCQAPAQVSIGGRSRSVKAQIDHDLSELRESN